MTSDSRFRATRSIGGTVDGTSNSKRGLPHLSHRSISAYADSSATPSVLGLLDGPPSRTSQSGVSVRCANKVCSGALRSVQGVRVARRLCLLRGISAEIFASSPEVITQTMSRREVKLFGDRRGFPTARVSGRWGFSWFLACQEVS